MNRAVKISKQTNDSSEILWSRESGLGNVKFDNANSPVTTGMFSEVGEHILKLTAGKDELKASSILKVKVEPMPPAENLEPIEVSNFKISIPYVCLYS